MELCRPIEKIGEVVKELHALIDNGIVILQGDLAAGKTTLVQALAQSFGVKEAVTSPTFSLQQNYGERLFHYDIYNHGLDQFMSLGLFEELEKEGLHLIEWGDDRLVELLSQAGFEVVKVTIKKERDQRCYKITKVG